MNKKLVIGIILAIVVIAVAIGAVVMVNSNNNDNQNIASDNNENVNNAIENMNNEDNNVQNEENTTNTDNNIQVSSNKKTLVAYFSLPENTGTAREDSTVTVNGERLGTTQYVANLIQEHTGADVFRIESVKQYNTEDHQALIDDAQEEQRQNARPEIKNKVNNFDEYDTIFIGYPIWWSDLPQILYTFLESYDFTGKNVYLFSTNGGSGLSGTVSTITNKLSGAKVNSNAFKLHRNSMEDAPEEVETWLKQIDIID